MGYFSARESTDAPDQAQDRPNEGAREEERDHERPDPRDERCLREVQAQVLALRLQARDRDRNANEPEQSPSVANRTRDVEVVDVGARPIANTRPRSASGRLDHFRARGDVRRRRTGQNRPVGGDEREPPVICTVEGFDDRLHRRSRAREKVRYEERNAGRLCLQGLSLARDVVLDDGALDQASEDSERERDREQGSEQNAAE